MHTHSLFTRPSCSKSHALGSAKKEPFEINLIETDFTGQTDFADAKPTVSMHWREQTIDSIQGTSPSGPFYIVRRFVVETTETCFPVVFCKRICGLSTAHYYFLIICAKRSAVYYKRYAYVQANTVFSWPILTCLQTRTCLEIWNPCLKVW